MIYLYLYQPVTELFRILTEFIDERPRWYALCVALSDSETDVVVDVIKH